MKSCVSHSEALLSEVRKELVKRGVSLHRFSKEIGCSYMGVYFALLPEKRQRKRIGPAKFSYEFGKKVEVWLKTRPSR